MTANHRLRGSFMPLVFIGAGILLLLNSLELVDWAVWPRLARFWPILVIAFGANLLWQHFRRARP